MSQDHGPFFDYEVHYVDLCRTEQRHVIKQASGPGKALARFDSEIPSANRIKILGVRKVVAGK